MANGECLIDYLPTCKCYRICTCHTVCTCDYVCTEFTNFNSSNCTVYCSTELDGILNNGQYEDCALEPN